MAYPVVQTAVCACSFGAAPAPLTVTSQPTVKICGMAAATIMDGTMANLPSFGMCSCPSNPAVIAATAAAAGVFTPAPRAPAAVSWAPGCPTVQVCKLQLLNNSSKLMCSYGGVIQVSATPAVLVNVP